jgi:two-component system sensor histidine kinase KdpD
VPPDEIDEALRTEFSDETLARLREQAFRMVAWHADQQQIVHLRNKGETAQWEARPRVMACVADHPGMERLIRRAAGLAASLDTDRSVTVRTGEAAGTEFGERYAVLTAQLGGQVVRLDGAAIAPSLARYARENLVTELLITRESRGRKRAGATVRELIRALSEVDIHILSAG